MKLPEAPQTWPRHGKSGIAAGFRRARHPPSGSTATEEPGADAVVIRVRPGEGTTVRFGPKVRGTSMEIRDGTVDFAHGESFTESGPEAGEPLILDVLLGDAGLFPRHQEAEESWRLLYRRGARGPARQARAVPLGHLGARGTDEMLVRDGRSWRRP